LHGIRNVFVSAALALICTDSHAQNARAAPAWTFSASASAYFVPDDTNYIQPTVTADRGRLHLEARYNYEDQKTGSGWVGYNFSVDRKVSLKVTPMMGGVFGRTAGIAPGFHTTFDWRRLEIYSEGEWVLNTREITDSFFYSWSEVTLAPRDWLQGGVVEQRTRAYQSERDIQPGILVRLNYKRMSLTANVFNPDQKKPLYVISLAVEY